MTIETERNSQAQANPVFMTAPYSSQDSSVHDKSISRL